jgi:thiol-disulfide isomerase/thioredoxin
MKSIISIVLIIVLFLNSNVLSAQVGNPAPDFTVTDVHGKKHHLYDYLNQGKKVVLDFFFTTCIPCQFYSPQVNLAYEKYGCNTQDVVFLSIDYNDTDAEVMDYENTYKIKFPSASGLGGGGNAVVSQYQVIGFPSLLLIDSTKKVVDKMDPPTLVVFDFKFSQHGIVPKPCLTSTSAGVEDFSMTVFPNPSRNGELFVSVSNRSNEESRFELSDYTGRSLGNLSKRQINETTYCLDISETPVGNYLLKLIRNKHEPYVVKFSVMN